MELADADPRRWPVRDLQLKGIWQQQGLAHAVLGRGLQQVVVVPGQRVGREDLRVLRVAETEVILLPADAAGPPLHLSLPGAEK
jgi:Tfp pilus assembly protein PilP